MKFLLVDQITAVTPGESLTGRKTLSLAEEYLADHFPGFPVMPGVMMLEALTQASAWLMRITEEFRFSTVLLREAKAVKFNNFLTPGDSLTLQTDVSKKDGNDWTFKASGTVTKTDGTTTNTLSGKLTLVQFNLADSDEALAASDETATAFWKGLYPQVRPRKG